MATLPDSVRGCVIVTTTFIVLYWGNGLLILALDRYLPESMDRFRIQKKVTKHSRPPYDKLIKTLLVNTAIVPVVLLAMGKALDLSNPETLAIPGPFEMFLSTLANVIVNEILFFYGHWAFHANKFLYGRVHKIHHEFKSPIALAALYCHPIELVVSDFLPLGLGVLFFNHNVYQFTVYAAFSVLGTQTHHCGFRWPWIASHGNQPDFHDFHHYYFSCNYGNIGFLDALHGTAIDPRKKDVPTKGVKDSTAASKAAKAA